MSFWMRWTPTFVAGFLLALAGFLQIASLSREERRKDEQRKAQQAKH